MQGLNRRWVVALAAVILILLVGVLIFWDGSSHSEHPGTVGKGQSLSVAPAGPQVGPLPNSTIGGDSTVPPRSQPRSSDPTGAKQAYPTLKEYQSLVKRDEDQSAMLSGVIRDETGKVRNDAEIALYLDAPDFGMHPGKIRDLVSEGRGYFPRLSDPFQSVGTDPSGNYEIRLEDPEGLGTFWIRVSAPACADVVDDFRIAPGDRRKKDFEIDCRTADIRGRVAGQQGGPVPGARVAARFMRRADQAAARGRLLTTDESGKFFMRDLPVSESGIHLDVWAPGYLGQSRDVRIEVGTEQEVEFRLDSTRSVFVQILDSRDRRPVAGASAACRLPERPEAFVLPERSDEQGRITLGLPPEPVSWSCLIQAYGYQRRVVTLSTESVPDPVLLDPTAELAGCVTSTLRRPIEGATVVVAGQSWSGSAETDAAGCFAVDSESATITEVRVAKRGYISSGIGAKTGLSSPVMIVLQDAETGVNGKATQNGVPMGGPFSIELSCAETGLRQTFAFSESQGSFEIMAVPAGVYDMEFVTLPTKDLKIFRASLRGVELRRGFVTGPLVVDLEQQSLTDTDRD